MVHHQTKMAAKMAAKIWKKHGFERNIPGGNNSAARIWRITCPVIKHARTDMCRPKTGWKITKIHQCHQVKISGKMSQFRNKMKIGRWKKKQYRKMTKFTNILAFISCTNPSFRHRNNWTTIRYHQQWSITKDGGKTWKQKHKFQQSTLQRMELCR